MRAIDGTTDPRNNSLRLLQIIERPRSHRRAQAVPANNDTVLAEKRGVHPAMGSSTKARTDRAIEIFVYALTQHPGLIVATHICVGALFMWAIEGWTPGSAIYFCILTLTTVGYGDLVPKSEFGRLFAALHTLVGCTMAATCLGTLVGHMQASIPRPLRGGGAGAAAGGGGAHPLASSSRMRTREVNALLKAQLAAGGAIGVGMLYGAFVEEWSLLDAFYWAVISCSSVGFGDLTPSAPYRPLAAIYLLLAVGGFASAAAQVTRTAAAMERQRQVEAFAARGVDAEMIDQMDSTGDGRVDRVEFLRHMLVANGLVEAIEIEKLEALFDALDADGSGSLDAADMRRTGAGGGGGGRGGGSGGCGGAHGGCGGAHGGCGGLAGGAGSGDEELCTFAMPFAMPSNCTSSEGSETADEAAPLNQAARMLQPMARTRGPRNV